jgi:hypothetical protein
MNHDIDTVNYIRQLNEAETKAYRTDEGRRNGLQSEAERLANSRQCDVCIMAADGKNLWRAWPRSVSWPKEGRNNTWLFQYHSV